MSVRFTMRQEPSGRWRATSPEHGIALAADGRDECLDLVHRAAVAVLPAVSWTSGPPVVELEVTPRLVGVAEAADILGWDKRRVATYAARGSFPEPIVTLAGGRVWAQDDVVAFGRAFRERQRARATMD